jgi:hypothetical protein
MYYAYLKVTDSKNGKGVFTSVEIPANTPILEVRGQIVLEKDLGNLDPAYVLQVGPNSYIGPSGGVDDYVNHNCSPNCYLHIVGNRAILYSLYVIPKGAELTFDYSTSSTDTLDVWKMDCKCSSFKCRKVISGFQYLDENLKKEYIDKGMVPMFMTNPIFRKK